MHSVIEVLFGLATTNGAWFGIRVKREIHTLIADRNADVLLEGQKTTGGPPSCNERPSDCETP